MFSYQKVLQTNVGTEIYSTNIHVPKIDERSWPIYDAHPKVYVCYRYTFRFFTSMNF